MSQSPQKDIFVPSSASIQQIICPSAFSRLELKERLYAYYFTRACWSGSKICYFQRSFESPGLFYILYKIFESETPQELQNKLKENGFSESEIKCLWVYIGSFFQNCGNYLSFGDTKFIPDILKDKFLLFIKKSKAFLIYEDKFLDIWNNIEKEIFETNSPYWEIGLPDENGLSSYYSVNITRKDTQFIEEFLKKYDISALNTRILKHSESSYEIRVASVENSKTKYEYEGKEILIQKGDFSPFLAQVNKYLEMAMKYTENEHQTKMIQAYIAHFNGGDMNLHKESQKHWIADKGPIIETNIGFIEVYLDPTKNRAEWEGFVAVVDKEKSKILGKLIDNAPNFIELLPWGKEFEVDVFKKPDFTSLDVLTFACSGTPIGINIPNYDDIRQNIGFKNVDLGNAYGEMKPERVLFTEEKLKELYVKYHKESLFVIVALHELLGHGTGKLFAKGEDGKYNFDIENLKNPLTNEKITTFYNVGETWHSKFSDLSGAYEECRADSVAIYLATFDEVLDCLLPGYDQKQKEEILICCWYDVVYSAIRGLREFSEESMKWGQAHMSGNYAILKTILDADENFVRFYEVVLPPEIGKNYMNIVFDHSKIKTVGRKAMGEFLKKLQIYKSIGDPENGLKFFESMIKVDEKMLKWRKIAMQNSLPRRIEQMDDLKLIKDGEKENVEYLGFNGDFNGLISSQIYHYQGEIEAVYDLWRNDIKYFKYKF